jgi:hypothetical protein
MYNRVAIHHRGILASPTAAACVLKTNIKPETYESMGEPKRQKESPVAVQKVTRGKLTGGSKLVKMNHWNRWKNQPPTGFFSKLAFKSKRLCAF